MEPSEAAAAHEEAPVRRLIGAVRRLGAPMMLAAAALLVAAAPSLGYGGDVGEERDMEELPEAARVQFRIAGAATFYPQRLILIGPRRAVSAELPRRAKVFDENILPLGKARGVGPAFRATPLIDRIGAGSTLGGLYRAGDALVAVFESEGAYRDAEWRLAAPIGLVTRLSRGRGLASMRFTLNFRPFDRSRLARGGLEGPIGAAHGLRGMLALTPPRRSLPRNNIF